MSVAELARDIGRVGRYRAQGVEGALAFSVVVRMFGMCLGVSIMRLSRWMVLVGVGCLSLRCDWVISDDDSDGTCLL